MLLNHILRKYAAGYKLSRSQEKINYLMYMDNIKLFAKDEKELETLIHTEYTVWTLEWILAEKNMPCSECSKKWQTTSDWQNGSTKSRQD